MSETKGLISLGSGVKREAAKQKKPKPEWLETFSNPHPGGVYLVPFVQDRDEFTSLCPKTGQPDHARVEILYVPNKLMVESKTLKEYLVTFRNHGEFHEDCMNRIAQDLAKLLKPKYVRVFGNFAARGGLAIRPMVEVWGIISDAEADAVKRVVTAWDLKQ